MDKTIQVFTGLEEGLQEFPFITELAMEDYILSNPNILKFGFDNITIDKRDFEKPLELSNGKLGRVDLFVMYNGSIPVIVELKNSILEEKHLNQLIKYLETNDKDKFLPENASKDTKWGGILIGTGVNSTLYSSLKDSAFEIALVQLNRFRTSLDQSLIVSNLIYPFQNLEDSSYSFNGSSLSRSKLVWACINDYIKKHPDVTFDKLNKLVNIPRIGDKLKVLFNEKAIPSLSKSYQDCYYNSKGQLIALEDDNNVYAVLGWWDKANIKTIKDILLNLGYEIDNYVIKIIKGK